MLGESASCCKLNLFFLKSNLLLEIELHGKYRVLTSDYPSVWINAFPSLSKPSLISQLFVKVRAKPCWMRVYQQRWRVFRSGSARYRDAELRIFELLDYSNRALKRLAELNYVDDTRWEFGSSNESNRIIGCICIRWCSFGCGLYHFGLQAFNTLNGEMNFPKGTTDAIWRKMRNCPCTGWHQWTQITPRQTWFNHQMGMDT